MLVEKKITGAFSLHLTPTSVSMLFYLHVFCWLIPEQTLEEAERTKQFAVEVVDLLRHSPQCRMPFNKFIPAYHHHFGKQCRVADYGFTKLIELFESIPHILKVRCMLVPPFNIQCSVATITWIGI